MTKDQIKLNKKGVTVFLNKSKHWERAFKVTCAWCGIECYCRQASLVYKKQFCSLDCQRSGVGFRVTGDKHPMWKGGDRISKGYRILMRPDHPKASRDGYVLEHRIVMEGILGRLIEKHEIIHHIDGDKLNNKPENLYLCVNNVSHKTLHGSLERIAYDLVRKGVIKFKDGEYYKNEDSLY